jgi:probable rRNA maturation factor
MERKMLCKIDFENRQELLPLSYKLKMLVRRAVETTLDYEQYENPIEVSVTFTDNEGIRELNRKFRNIDRPTDVLSFPLFDYTGESEEPPVDEFVGMLGDIVISLEQAKKQAEEFGHSFEREAAFLTVHSMLHLLGYDHEAGGDEEADMRRRQREILDRMGLSLKGTK